MQWISAEATCRREAGLPQIPLLASGALIFIVPWTSQTAFAGMNIVQPTFADYVSVALIGGPLGALAMYGVVRILNSAGWVRGNIILAIGDLFFRGKRAFRSGLVIHLGTSIAFAPLYLFVFWKLGLTTFPSALLAGIFFGFFHGVFVTLGLVWVSSNRPMLPEFTGARLPLAVMHWVGHIAYGAVLGLVISRLVRS